MTIVPFPTTRNATSLLSGCLLVIVSATASGQQAGPYPLHGNPARPTPDNTIPTDAQQIQISKLPAFPSATNIQQQSFQQDFNSAERSKNSLTSSFEAAYDELDIESFAAPEFSDLPIPVDQPAAHLAVVSENGPSLNGNFVPNSSLEPVINWDETHNDFLTGDSSSVDQEIWWKEKVLSAVHSPGSLQTVDTNGLVYRTLQSSPRILALSQNPLIRELQVVEADSGFDPTSFVKSQFQDRVDPVGDNLSITADGSDFLNDNIWSGEFGIRKKNRTGMTYEVGQTLGFKNSNSSFFVPQDQGTATLALNVTQPLLRGRGRYYNESQILIAQSTGGAAWDTFVGELQDEIQKTVKSYWQLYFDRSVYLQKQRNVERGEMILRTLEGRRELDSLPSQIARARSAVLSRKTDLANALRDIRNSETELRRLTADRNWKANQNVEMIPTESPTTDGLNVEIEQVVLTALQHRPEIKETMARAKIAGVQRDISQNELLPELSLLMGTYVSALKGDSQLGQAIQDQFGEVTPGYSVGVEFGMPFGNRAARSRLTQRKLQLAKISAEVDQTIQNVIAASHVSLRRVTSAKETLDAAKEAIHAANADLEQNYRRWESFALVEGDLAEGQTPTTVLDQLLDSQERLTASELVYTQSELELKSAEVSLRRTMGTLLLHQNVTFSKNLDGDVPQMQIDHGQAAGR